MNKIIQTDEAPDHYRQALAENERMRKALEDLDQLLDFGDANLDSVWTFDDIAPIQRAFNQARAALAKTDEKSK